jgi:hypothetical protein
VRQAFRHACLIADAAVLRGRRFGNLVLAASDRELPVDRLTRLAASDPMPGRVLHGHELTRFAAGAKPVTDANATPSPAAPPDAFASLAPIFRSADRSPVWAPGVAREPHQSRHLFPYTICSPVREHKLFQVRIRF